MIVYSFHSIGLHWCGQLSMYSFQINSHDICLWFSDNQFIFQFDWIHDSSLSNKHKINKKFNEFCVWKNKHYSETKLNSTVERSKNLPSKLLIRSWLAVDFFLCSSKHSHLTFLTNTVFVSIANTFFDRNRIPNIVYCLMYKTATYHKPKTIQFYLFSLLESVDVFFFP